MGRKLSAMSWKEVQQEMSIAGNAEKIVAMAKDIQSLIASRIDINNIPDYTNTIFALDVIKADLNRQAKCLLLRQHGPIPRKKN